MDVLFRVGGQARIEVAQILRIVEKGVELRDEIDLDAVVDTGWMLVPKKLPVLGLFYRVRVPISGSGGWDKIVAILHRP